jgi:type VI secretion system protein ImpF
MAVERQIRITPSVFDRLIDLDPRTSTEPPKSRSATLEDLRISVRRDLEWLLSTRQALYETDGLDEAPRSVAFYGVPDFTALGAMNPEEFGIFSENLRKAIEFFEPRLLDVEITFEPVSTTDRQIRFRIDARLDIDPAPEPISFDSVISPGEGKITLLGGPPR